MDHAAGPAQTTEAAFEMSTRTQAWLGLGWTAFGVGAIALGVTIDMHALIIPGFLLILLGLGMALHVQQVERFEKPDEGE
jgi:hypothetical protein